MAACSSLSLIRQAPPRWGNSEATCKTNKADVTAEKRIGLELGGILTDSGACTYACILLLGSVQAWQPAFLGHYQLHATT